MYADVVKWVSSCQDCGRRKRQRRGASAGLHPVTPPSDRPFDMIGMDFVNQIG